MKTNTVAGVVIWGILSLSSAGVIAAPADGGAARTFIRDGIDCVLTILKDRSLDRPRKLDALRQAFKHYFDHAFIARYAAGRYFQAADPDQRRRYVRTLEDFLVHAYGSRMLVYSDEIDLKLKATDIFAITRVTEPRRNYFVVHTHINRRIAEIVRINWHVRRREGAYKVVDVVVMGISQARRYRSDFTAVIARDKRGLPGLTTALREKVDAYRRDARQESR